MINQLFCGVCLLVLSAATAHAAIQETSYASPTGSGSVCSETQPQGIGRRIIGIQADLRQWAARDSRTRAEP